MTIWRLNDLINETKNKYFLFIEFSRQWIKQVKTSLNLVKCLNIYKY
jgi:hypothetical protein